MCVAGIGASSACGEKGELLVALRSQYGETELTYRCSNIEPQARSVAEREVVRKEFSRIVGLARDEGRSGDVLPLMDAGVEDFSGLERLVVQRVCEEHGWPRAEAAGHPVFPAVGSLAPAFEAPVLTEEYLQRRELKIVSLDEHRGEIVVLYFWASWCSPCVKRLGAMGQLARDYGASEVTIYGVLHKERRLEHALQLLEVHNAVEFTPLIDRDGEIGAAYLIRGLPWMFVIDHDGRMAGRCSGCGVAPWDDAGVRARLDSLRVELAKSRLGRP